MKLVRLCTSLIILCLCATAPSAHASEAEYQQHSDKAKKLLRNDDRRGAIKEFEAAYAASPKPEALFNIGVLYRKLAEAGGNVEDARRSVDTFELYLESYRKTHNAEPPDLITVERYRSELRTRFALNEPEHATDPKEPEHATAPKESEPKVAIATPAPVITAPVEAHRVNAPTLPIAPIAVVPARVPPSSAHRRTRLRIIVGSVLIGAGVVVAAAGGTLLALGTSDGTASDYATAAAFNDHAATFQITGGTLLGVGGAAIVAGMVTLVLPSKADSSTALRFSPTVNGLVASGSF